MAREKTKKDPADYSVEEKLKNLYALQSMLSEIDSIKTLRGELPLEVQDLEDEIEGMTTRIEKITADIAELKREISERNAKIAENKTNIERYNAQMDSVRNNREYDSLTKQVEYAELDNQLHEKKIREAKEIVDAKTAEMTRCNLDVNDRRVMLETKKEELEEIVSETKAEEEKLIRCLQLQVAHERLGLTEPSIPLTILFERLHLELADVKEEIADPDYIGF